MGTDIINTPIINNIAMNIDSDIEATNIKATKIINAIIKLLMNSSTLLMKLVSSFIAPTFLGSVLLMKF